MLMAHVVEWVCPWCDEESNTQKSNEELKNSSAAGDKSKKKTKTK